MKVRTLLPALLLLLFFNCGGPQPMQTVALPKGEQAKSIVLMIGDGMVLTQISAALFTSKDPLALESFPITGLQKSHAYDDLITDSGAAATAIACGIKTFKFAVGVDKDTLPCKSIMEEAKERGMATGVVVTSTLVHATPAGFLAHQPMRALHEKIALDFLKSDVDFFVGGGKNFFDSREDGRNLVMELESKGYDIYDYKDGPLQQLMIDGSRKFGYFTSDKDPMAVAVGRNYFPYATEMGADVLNARTRNGFFLLAEGSQIDWAGHANEGEWLIEEVLDFDKAVERVLKFAKRKGDILVIVTADHETGGMAIQPGSTKGDIKTAFLTNEHTPSLVPVFAYGPGAELFAGVYDNTQIYYKMRQALGWDKEKEE